MIITTPDFSFAKRMQESAPQGIIARPGQQRYGGQDGADAPAILLVGIKEPSEITKDQFIRWLIGETSTEDRCVIDYYGDVVDKNKGAIGAVFDLMVERKNKPNTE